MEPLNWLIRIVVYGLAVFRLARLISLEDGPGDLFLHLRQRFGVRIKKALNTDKIESEFNQLTSAWDSRYVEIEEEIAETPLARFISCPLCVSVWLALPAVAGVFLPEVFFDIVASWLALSGITVLLHRDE